MERELENDMSKQAYLGRIAEMAVRLATIRAAGHSGPRARIDLLDMEWGAGVAGTAITSMMRRAENCLAPTVRGEFAEKLIRIIRQHGSITRRKLQQRIKGRYRTQEVNDMLTQAIEAGLIVRLQTATRLGSYRLGMEVGARRELQDRFSGTRVAVSTLFNVGVNL